MDKYSEDVPSWDGWEEYLNNWRCEVTKKFSGLVRLEDGRLYHIDSILPTEKEATARALELPCIGTVRLARTLTGFVVFEYNSMANLKELK